MRMRYSKLSSGLKEDVSLCDVRLSQAIGYLSLTGRWHMLALLATLNTDGPVNRLQLTAANGVWCAVIRVAFACLVDIFSGQ